MGGQDDKSCMLLKKLYGRENEVKLLHSVYDRVTRQQDFHQSELMEYDDNGQGNEDDYDSNGVQLVLIGGQSGTGKSDLVWHTFSRCCPSKKKKDCIFGYGKFQKRRDSKPLSVVSNIMTEIILSLQEMPNAQDYKTRVSAELGNDERLVIAKLVPMVAECADIDASGVDISLDTKEGLDQLKSAFRHFLRIISTVDPTRFPVVMCLDDIQWACDSTLDMFTSILTDPELRHVVVIACYRDDELDTACSCGKIWMEAITERFAGTNNQHRINRIQLGNLAVLAIKELISDILKLDIDNAELAKLAELIQSRTCGNPFHVLQLVDHLKAEGLIKRNELTYRWTWDYDTVHQKTVLSDNVATIVTAKMKRFASEVQNCLRLASCLGFRFCPQVLTLLVEHNVIECDNVDQSIQIAIDEGLVESSDDGRLRFVHDKVYETAYQMVASEEAQARVHFIIGAALLQYYFKDSSDGDVIILDQEERVLKDERTLFLCVDQLKLAREFIIGGSDDLRMKAVKLQLEAAKMSISYSAFVPAINYLEESLYLLQKGKTSSHDDEINENDPKFVLLTHAEKFFEIVHVKDRTYRLHSYKNCFVGSEAVDVMIRHAMAETRDEAVSLGRQLCEKFNLFEHVTGGHEFKDEHLFYRFSQKKKRTQDIATAAMGSDEKSYCDLFVKINTRLAEMYVTTGRVELAMKIIDMILNNANIECEAKIPIYLIKCRILSNQSKHRVVIRKALFILNYLEGKNYTYVEEPGKVRFKFELQRIKWNLNKLSDEDILSLPLIQGDSKENKRVLFIFEFIELTLFECWQAKLFRLAILLGCRFVQLTLDHGIAPLSPVGFASLAGKVLGSGNKTHQSKFPKLPNVKLSLNLKSATSRNSSDRGSDRSSSSGRSSDRSSGRSSDRDSMDISSRLGNLAIALAKKQIEAKVVARGMAGVYFSSSMVNHLRQPMTLVVDDLIKGYEFGMKIGDIQNSFRNITAYFMFYFYSGLPLTPLLPDLKRFMKQMMDYSNYSHVRLNIPVYQCVLNLTGRDNMLNPVDIYHGTAVDLRSKICQADGNSCEENKNKTYDGQESEWSYLMQIAFYCGEMEIAWEMYEKLQGTGYRHLDGSSPFFQARVFFFALIEMWYAKSTGKNKYNKDATKHVRVVRGWVNHQGMINCVHKLQILEAELLSLDPQQNLDELKKAYDTAIVSATRAGFLQDAAVANYLAGIHFKRVLMDDDDVTNDTSHVSASSSCSITASFSRLSDLSSFRASTASSSSSSFNTASLSSISNIDPDNYFIQARDMYDTWGATAVIKALESNFPRVFSRNDSVPSSPSKTGARGFRSRERFRESTHKTHSKLPDHLRGSVRHLAPSKA